MAIVKKNFLLKGISGSIGKMLVLKRVNGKTVVCSYPNRSGVVLSDRQVAANQKFKEAVAFARELMADPHRKAAFAAGLKRGQRVYQCAIKAYFKERSSASPGFLRQAQDGSS